MAIHRRLNPVTANGWTPIQPQGAAHAGVVLTHAPLAASASVDGPRQAPYVRNDGRVYRGGKWQGSRPPPRRGGGSAIAGRRGLGRSGRGLFHGRGGGAFFAPQLE